MSIWPPSKSSLSIFSIFHWWKATWHAPTWQPGLPNLTVFPILGNPRTWVVYLTGFKKMGTKPWVGLKLHFFFCGLCKIPSQKKSYCHCCPYHPWPNDPKLVLEFGTFSHWLHANPIYPPPSKRDQPERSGPWWLAPPFIGGNLHETTCWSKRNGHGNFHAFVWFVRLMGKRRWWQR